MAAGLGQRLGDLTKALPKALIEVAGRTLLDRALEFARQVGVDQRIVVGGFCYADVANHVAGVDPKAQMVENRDFRLGNAISLRVGHDALSADGSFLLMNTDHIYRQQIAEVVRHALQSANSVTAVCDFDRQLTEDDMKVELDADRCVVAMSKKLTRWDAGYVGMTIVPAQARRRYATALRATLEAQGDHAVAEQVLVRLAEGGERPAIADISGIGWYEVDEPHERERAEQALLVEGAR